MKVICKRCNKSFTLFKSMKEVYTSDGLCSKCRARHNYSYRYNQNKVCPTCNKRILNSSKQCSRCSQLGTNNHNYIHGNASSLRTCKICNAPISTGSKKLCASCYSKTLCSKGNPNYKHGHYIGNFCSTAEYKFWKIKVFERDNWTCALCGKEGRITSNAHHILPKRDYPELVYDINNGITLCYKCHETTFGKEYDFVEQLQQKIRPNQNSVNSVNAEMPIPSQV